MKRRCGFGPRLSERAPAFLCTMAVAAFFFTCPNIIRGMPRDVQRGRDPGHRQVGDHDALQHPPQRPAGQLRPRRGRRRWPTTRRTWPSRRVNVVTSGSVKVASRLSRSSQVAGAGTAIIGRPRRLCEHRHAADLNAALHPQLRRARFARLEGAPHSGLICPSRHTSSQDRSTLLIHAAARS